MGRLEGEETEKQTEEILEAIMTENFSKFTVRQQTTGPESSENTTQDKYQKNLYLRISYLY